MASWRLWLRKVVTGLVAILLVGFQMLVSVSTPVGMHTSGYQYVWSEHGMVATWLEVQPFTLLSEEVREENVRDDTNKGRERRRKAAS